jgi:membrane protein involved in colicin uptake
MTPSELAALLREQLEPCWKGPMATPAFAGQEVAIEIKMTPDGAVEDVTPAQPDQVTSSPILRALADAAMQAILACSPLDMATAPYEDWQNVVLIFRGENPADPSGP